MKFKKNLTFFNKVEKRRVIIIVIFSTIIDIFSEFTHCLNKKTNEYFKNNLFNARLMRFERNKSKTFRR